MKYKKKTYIVHYSLSKLKIYICNFFWCSLLMEICSYCSARLWLLFNHQTFEKWSSFSGQFLSSLAKPWSNGGKKLSKWWKSNWWPLELEHFFLFQAMISSLNFFPKISRLIINMK